MTDIEAIFLSNVYLIAERYNCIIDVDLETKTLNFTGVSSEIETELALEIERIWGDYLA